MKKAIFVVIGIVLVFSASSYARDAAGSAFGAMSTAGTLGMGEGNFGLGIGLADQTSFWGSFNYGLSDHMDGRIKVGLIDTDGDDTELAIGADFKYQIVSVTGVSNGPFDMAIGGLFEYFDLGGVSVVQLGGHYTGSYPIKLESGGTLTPYGRFNARVEMINYDSDLIDDDSNLEIGINGGVQWQINSSISLFGEFQFDGNDGLFLGIDFGAL